MNTDLSIQIHSIFVAIMSIQDTNWKSCKVQFHLLGYGFQTKQYTKLQHMVSIFRSTEPYPAHDEKTQDSGTTPPNHLLIKQNTC